jgi:hypothetical protein
VTLIDGCSQRFKSLERGRMRLPETHDQLVVGADTEVFDDDAHGRNRELLKSRLTSASAVECVTVAKARPTSLSPAVKVGDKTYDRNKRQKNDVRTEKENMRASRMKGSDVSIGRVRFGSHPGRNPRKSRGNYSDLRHWLPDGPSPSA